MFTLTEINSFIRFRSTRVLNSARGRKWAKSFDDRTVQSVALNQYR